MMPATKTPSRTIHSCTPQSRTLRSFHSAAGLGLGLLSLLMSAGTAVHAGTVNWDGTAADWFSNPSHWVGGAYPGATDDAVNKSTAAMTLGQSTTINSFFSNGAFTLQGGTFSGSRTDSSGNPLGTITVNNVFTDDGGTISSFIVNQGTGGSVVFTTNGGNAVSGDVFNAGVDLSASNAYVRMFNTNVFNGNVSLGASGANGIHLYDGNTNFVVGANGSLTGFGGVVQDNGGATLTNNGTVNASVSGQTLNLALANFNNNGLAEATNGGILTLNNTNTNNNGLLAATGGGILDISGTLNANTGNSINGVGGTVNVLGAALLGTVNETAGTSLVFNTDGNNALNGTTVNGNLDLSTNSNAYVRLFGVDTVNGNVSLGASGNNGIHLYDGNTNFVVGANGSLTGFGGVVQDNGGATLTNGGTVNANSAGKTLNLAVSNFNNNGLAEATNGGILTLNSTSTNAAAGSTLAASGAGSIVSIAGTYTGAGNNLIAATSGGQVQVNGAALLGTINTDAKTSLVFNTDGNNALNGTTVNGNLDLSTNSNAYVRLFNTDTVNGNVSLGASGANGIHLYDGNTNFVVGANGSLTGFGGVVQDNGGATLTNGSTVNANSKGNTLNLALANFNNAGTAEATNGGILTLNNTNTNNNGLLAATGGGILDISGTLNANTGNSINGVGGTVNVLGAALLGTVNETAGTSLVFNTDGNNALNGTTVNGNLDLSTNSNAYVRLFNTDTVNGSVSLGAGGANGIHLYDGNTNFVLNGTLSGFGTVNQDNGGATLTNGGTVNASSAANPLTLALTNFNNNGLAEATNGAALNLQNTSTNAAAGSTLAASGAGSIVSIAGTYTGTGSDLITTSGGGQAQVHGATLLGTINTDAKTSLVFNTDGNNALNGTTVNGNLDLSINSNAYVRLFNTDTVNGNVSLGASGANGIHLYDGNTNFVVGANGGLTGFGDVNQDNGGAALTNNGTVNATSGTLNVNTSNFANNGTTEVQNSATLNVGSANTDSGNILVKQGGTATFTQGVTQTGGLTQADGTLNSSLALTGGTLSGTGMVNGAVVNNGGTVSAGNAASPFGTLAVSGTFSQTAGVFDAGFSSIQNNLLTVSGAVTTGGLLNVSYLGAGPYTGSGPFTFLNYGTLASSITGTGPTRYFANETFDSSGNGLIAGSNGFLYELINNTSADGLQLQVLTNGAPTPAVPEASTTVSFGLLLTLGGLVVIVKRRRMASAA